MHQIDKINLVYRIICLMVYSIVIIFTNSLITLIIISIFFMVISFKEKSSLSNILLFFNIVSIGISYLLKNDIIFKLVLIYSYKFYYIDIPRMNKLDLEERIDNKKSCYDYIRFKKTIKSNNLEVTYYVTLHLIILFLSIMVG